MARRKRETPRERRAQWRVDHPDATPYDQWPEHSEYFSRQVADALADVPTDTHPTLYQDQHRRSRMLDAQHLAVALYAVDAVGEKGLTYGQLATCFRRALGIGCHRTLASALLKSLITLGLIKRIGNYSVGKRGNCYLIINDDAEQHRRRYDPALRLPPPTLRPESAPEHRPPPTDADDDPWT